MDGNLLEQLGFTIADPEAQEGLVADAVGIEPVGYINRYDLDRDNEVRCAFCAVHQKHQRGVTAELPDGRIALCGRCCAERIFPDMNRRHWSDLKTREKAAIARVRIGPLLEGIDVVVEAIRPFVSFEKQMVDACQQILKEVDPLEVKRRAGDRNQIAVEDSSGRHIGHLKDVDYLSASSRKLYEGASKLVRLKSELSASPTDEALLKAGLLRQDAVRDIEQGADLFKRGIAFFYQPDMIGGFLANSFQDGVSWGLLLEEWGVYVVVADRRERPLFRLAYPMVDKVQAPSREELVEPLRRR